MSAVCVVLLSFWLIYPVWDGAGMLRDQAIPVIVNCGPVSHTEFVSAALEPVIIYASFVSSRLVLLTAPWSRDRFQFHDGVIELRDDRQRA